MNTKLYYTGKQLYVSKAKCNIIGDYLCQDKHEIYHNLKGAQNEQMVQHYHSDLSWKTKKGMPGMPLLYSAR